MGQSVSQGRIDRDLGQEAQDPLVVVARRFEWRGPDRSLGDRGDSKGPPPVFAGPAHAQGIRTRDGDDAEVVQKVLGPHRFSADAVMGDRQVARHIRIEPMDAHDHGDVLIEGVHSVGQGRVGRGADHVVDTGQSEDVRGVPAAAPFNMEGVDHPAVGHRQGVVDRQPLVQSVGVEADLDIELLGGVQGGIERAQVRPGVLVDLEAADTGLELLEQRVPSR